MNNLLEKINSSGTLEELKKTLKNYFLDYHNVNTFQLTIKGEIFIIPANYFQYFYNENFVEVDTFVIPNKSRFEEIIKNHENCNVYISYNEIKLTKKVKDILLYCSNSNEHLEYRIKIIFE